MYCTISFYPYGLLSEINYYYYYYQTLNCFHSVMHVCSNTFNLYFSSVGEVSYDL